MKSITTHDAKTHLSRYLSQIEKGDSFIIMRGKKAVAKLSPLQPGDVSQRPKVGELVDRRVKMADDAFAPLSEEELKLWGL